MASIPTASLAAIDVDAAKAAQADVGGSSSIDEQGPISPISDQEKVRLEQLLKNRSDAKELVDKNILKQSNLAPALQAAQADLLKHQLEDKLEGRLERRPDREDLISRGILKDDAHGKVSPALQAKLSELERSRLEDRMEKEIGSRPTAEELRAKGILKEGE